MQFLQFVLSLPACRKCSVYTKILYVEGMVVVLLCCRAQTTWSSAVTKIYTRTIQTHEHRFDPLYLRFMALLWESLKNKQKKKTNIHEVSSVKSQETHMENRWCHLTTHARTIFFFFHWNTIYRIWQKSDLACNMVCSSIVALQFQVGSMLSKKTHAQSTWFLAS